MLIDKRYINFKSPLYKLIGVIVLCLYSSTLLGQYSFQQITREDGLSHNNVECILQDRDGFMWFGTRNGLCRFDGYEIKVFRNSSDSNSLSGNRILSIAEDQDGNLWIGTYQNGLNKFDKQTNTFTRYGEEIGLGNQIYRIKVFKNNSIYICTNNGLTIFWPEQGEFENVVPHEGVGSINAFLISDVLETRSGEIYVATWENDIQKFNPESKKFTSISYIEQGRDVLNYRKRLLEDNAGNIYISAQIHGLCRYDPKTETSTFFYKGETGLNSEVLNGDMILNTDGKIWISTDGGGINIFDPQKESFEYITHDNAIPESLLSNQVYTLFIDHSNRIWTGTFDKGVAYYDPLQNKFSNHGMPKEIKAFFKGKSVLSIFQDSRERIWIGTDGHGLHAIDKNKKIKSYYFEENNANTVSSNVITSIGEDEHRNILIGTYAGGLCVFDPLNEVFTRYQPNAKREDAIHSNNVWTLLSDSENNNWLGLLGSGADVFYSKEKVFKNIGPYSNELIKVGHPNVMCLLEDSDGDIWFGTEGDGIYILDKQAGKMLRLSTYPESGVVDNGVIKDLFMDSKGEIWIATEGNGLYKYNHGSREIVNYALQDGLPGMIVMGIQEDNSRNIWVSTYDGLAFKRYGTNAFTSFYKYDGLTSNEFNAEAFVKLKDGTLIVGSVDGLDIFDPMSISFNQNLPQVVLTGLYVSNEKVEPNDTVNNKVILNKNIAFTDNIVLDYNDKTFLIEFAALNFTHPQKCQYKYMLEGFDDDWIYTPFDRRMASYSHLNEGHYTFKVQASNNDGKWGNNTRELKISILPPFYKTVWFVLLVAAFVASIVVLIYIYRIRLIKNEFMQAKALGEKRIIELEKENIESELEKLTYYTLNRNRVLVNYKNKLSVLSIKAKESVRKGLQIVIDDIDNEIADDKEWKYLEPRLDKIYDEFITKLRDKHPDLKLSEIKVASYVRMNLTSKEISEYMHKTIRAVENDRYRLRKKIGLDSNESLQTYLLNL